MACGNYDIKVANNLTSLKELRKCMESDATLVPVLKLLDEEGYKLYHNPTKSQCYSFQKRVDDGLHYLCECNDKLSMNVDVWNYTLNGRTFRSVEMYMIHENSENDWFTLKVYGIDPKVFPGYYGRGFEKIMSAWRAVY